MSIERQRPSSCRQSSNRLESALVQRWTDHLSSGATLPMGKAVSGYGHTHRRRSNLHTQVSYFKDDSLPRSCDSLPPPRERDRGAPPRLAGRTKCARSGSELDPFGHVSTQFWIVPSSIQLGSLLSGSLPSLARAHRDRPWLRRPPEEHPRAPHGRGCTHRGAHTPRRAATGSKKMRLSITTQLGTG